MFRTISLKNIIKLCAALLLTSCATTTPATVQVSMGEYGQISVMDHKISLADLGQSVKKTGASGDTIIQVEIKDNTSPALQKSIIKTLSKAGFPKIIFKKEKQASAYIKR